MIRSLIIWKSSLIIRQSKLFELKRKKVHQIDRLVNNRAYGSGLHENDDAISISIRILDFTSQHECIHMQQPAHDNIRLNA